MPDVDLQILTAQLLPHYRNQVSESLLGQYRNLEDGEVSNDSFSFYTSLSAVFSSKIEGENIELDSYIKHKRFGIDYLPDYTLKIDDLYDAYQFAKTHPLDKENILAAHGLVAKNLLPPHKQSKIRGGHMFVTTTDGRIEYVAALPEHVPAEMENFTAMWRHF